MSHLRPADHFLSSLTGVPPQWLVRNGMPRWRRFWYRHECRRDVRLLIELGRLSSETRLLDIGFGTGRLVRGIVDLLGGVKRYTGVEVSLPHVQWCQRHFARYGFAEFLEVPMRNERYRPDGEMSPPSLDLADGMFDLACLFSVFTHLLPEDLEFYLAQLDRVLAPGGRVLLTLYLDDRPEEFAVNPKEGFGPFHDSPLHRVRYSRVFFASLIKKYGFGFVSEGRPWIQNQELIVLEKR